MVQSIEIRLGPRKFVLFRWVWFLRFAIGTTSLLLNLPCSTETNKDESFDYNNLAELYKFRVFKSIFIFSNEMICWRRENHENNCWRRDDYWVVSLLGQLISEKPASLPMWTLSNLAFSALGLKHAPLWHLQLRSTKRTPIWAFHGLKSPNRSALNGARGENAKLERAYRWGVKMPNRSTLNGTRAENAKLQRA